MPPVLTLPVRTSWLVLLRGGVLCPCQLVLVLLVPSPVSVVLPVFVPVPLVLPVLVPPGFNSKSSSSSNFLRFLRPSAGLKIVPRRHGHGSGA